MHSTNFFSSKLEISFLNLFLQASFPIKFIMLLLFLSSIWSWAVIVEKLINYRKIFISIKKFEKVFWSGRPLEELYISMKDCLQYGMHSIFIAAMQEWKKSFDVGAHSKEALQMRIDRAMNVAINTEISRMETNLSFLATIGSTAPFIGLFGTIIGIMTSFQSIAISKNNSISVVAPGISEALLATAIGLFAAIPALIAYNKFSSDINKINNQLERFSDEFFSILSRNIDEYFIKNKNSS